GETIIIEKQRAKVSFRIPSLFAYVLHARIRQLTVISLNYFLIAVKPMVAGLSLFFVFSYLWLFEHFYIWRTTSVMTSQNTAFSPVII
ncbi:MAG: hypothetical protein IJA51_00910, partial [Oscillospiraceae bacterium]|nr:hypothetical protein [Oscillospiraceae bacterium]